MLLRRLVIPALSVGILASAACAHQATSADATEAPKAARIQPPKMLRGAVPRLRTPGKFDAKIEVMIRADGQPEMTTLVITGSMSGEIRSELRDWIQDSQFEPARQGGLAVPAVFKMSMSVR
jgi:hypothetical protein